MSEEEIIKQLNSLILEKRYYTEYHAWVGTKTFEAIQGLLDLYEKAKEKNKKLQEKCKGLIKEKQELSTAILYENIHKDKIREKIKELEKQDKESSFSKNYLIIPVLKEILEEE